MADYLALPNETKDLIVVSPQDLSCLSRISKAMHMVLLPRLYKQIALRWEASKSPPRVSSLLETLAQAPDLAKKVEGLALYGEDYLIRAASVSGEQFPYLGKVMSYLVDAKPKANANDVKIERLLQRARRNRVRVTRLPQAEWSSLLEGQDTLDIKAAAIVVLCPNLRVLYLSSAFLNQNKGFSKIIHHHHLNYENECATTAFTKLKKVHLGQDLSSWNAINLELLNFPILAYLPFFCLPSLELISAALHDSIGGSGLSPPSIVGPTTTTTPPACNVSTLDLHTSRARAGNLSLILANTPHRKSLRYEYWPWMEARPKERLDCTEARIGIHRSHTHRVDYFPPSIQY